MSCQGFETNWEENDQNFANATFMNELTVRPTALPSKTVTTVVDLLRAWADYQPDAMLYRFLRPDVSGNATFAAISDAQSLPESEGYTYGGMDRQARRIAVWLRQRVAPGECVILAFPPGPEYLAAYFGCLYAGVIAVPAYPPRRNQRDARLRSIIADAEVKIGLTAASLVDSIRAAETADAPSSKSANPSVVSWHTIDAGDRDAADDWVRPDISGKTLAFLQYTSGSTGSPKGVMVTHGNLLHNQHLVQSSFLSGHDDTLVGWLPLHHDMGLIGNALHPLYLGGDLVFMSPIDFLQKPSRWLQAISMFRGTVAGGPNFAYRLCADEIDDSELTGVDLSCWQVAFNGAEPIDSRVLRRFADRFANYGFDHSQFCPCYGMAETTLLVSSSVRGEAVRELPPDHIQDVPEASRSNWIGCGVPEKSMDVRIVDPETKTEMPAGEIGEIWIAGPSVAAGYWKNPEQTRDTFAAQILGCEKKYLRTGDLGLIDQATFPGELFVTGRCKDLIIINGVNHYPQDIERTSDAAHPANELGGSAAFSISGDAGERVVIVQELRRSQRRDANAEEVLDAIRDAVMAEHQLVPVSIVLIRPGGLPKTTSGKVQRSEARRQFENDGYRVLHRWDLPTNTQPTGLAALVTNTESTSEITRWLIDNIATRLKLPRDAIEVNEPVSRYGLDSIGAVRLAGALSEWLGRDIPATLAYEYPTIRSLANYLSGTPTGSTADADHTSQQPRRSQHAARHSEHHSGSSGPVAIVGIACRFPAADSPAEFWELLVAGRDATGECMHRRDWYIRSGLDPATPLRGGYLRDVDQFDGSFFGISPREADAIDPQHRLLLELTAEAFEDAGVPIASLPAVELDSQSGARVGVFVGVGNNDYLQICAGDGDANAVTAYTATGNSMAMASNRISYTFDFRGPSLTIDTACSSSLVATHQAVRALGAGDCDYAVAAAVNLILSTDATESFNKAGMLSPTGVCRTFDEQADGFVRGEGGGAVLLRPLSDALADGNRIYAVIQGSAVNQDGRSNGLTAPSRAAQAALIADALDDAGVSSESIDYVEAHGTGTPLGDPIEVRAIRQALLPNATSATETNRVLKIGSVKANIGHLEAAAGIAGLIKVALSIDKQFLPGQINFSSPSPHVDWSAGLAVVTDPTPWPSDAKRIRRAGVSSFGFGGTNAHVILEEPPVMPYIGPEPPTFSPGLLTCSAKTPTSLATMIQKVESVADQHDWPSLAYTLAAGRSHYRHRAAWVGTAAQRTTESESGWIHGIAARDAKVDWYFSGQGGCHLGAGRELYQTNAAFRHEFDLVAESFAKVAGHSLQDRLWTGEQLWLDVWIQPALYCLQVAIARYWISIGVKPRRLVGHSLGEYAAACVAGVFDFEDGLTLVVRRSELIGQLEQRGGMLAAFTDEASLREILKTFPGRWEIAVVNGPRQTVIASLPETLGSLADYLQQHGVTTRMMSTTHGFHSWLIDPIVDEFEQAVAMTAMMSPRLPFVSSQTGSLVGHEIATPAYWRGNLRNAVRFDRVFQEMAGSDPETSSLGLEIGVGSTLAGLARSAKLGLTVLPGISGDASAGKRTGSYWETLAKLYVYGVDFDWQAALGGTAPIISLPTYAFERQRHWVDAQPSAAEDRLNVQSTSAPRASESLLGERLDFASDDLVFENHFSANSYLADHRVGDTVVFPAAGWMQWAMEAGRSVFKERNVKEIELVDFEIGRSLALEEQRSQRCQLVLSQTDGDDQTWRGRFVSRSEAKWREHATFKLRASDSNHISRNCVSHSGSSLITETKTHDQSVNNLYQQLTEAGMQYGPAFRCIEQLASLGNHAEAIVSCLQSKASHHIGPLDACLQVVAACGTRWGNRTWVPVGADAVVIRGDMFTDSTEVRFHVSVELIDQDTDSATADLVIRSLAADHACSSSLTIQGLKLRATTPLKTAGLLLQNQWLPQIRNREPFTSNLNPLVSDSLASSTTPLTSEHNPGVLLAISESLEQAAGDWTIRILSRLGMQWTIGDTFTTQSLAKRCGVQPNHHRLLVRLLRISEELGVLRSQPTIDGQRWNVVALPIIGEYQTAHPNAVNEFALLNRCAAATAELMQHNDDPLPLLFPGNGQVSAADVYRDSVGGQRLNRLAAIAVSRRVHDLTLGRGLRILEIGGGTGATTHTVLEQLPAGRCEYVFTDVAPGFLAAAKRQFSEYDFIDFRVLDIERDPREQGFEESLGKFDIVIAANVLHATADLAVAMGHIRQLLHDSGELVVLEGTQPARWLDLTFGLTPGWWRFTDTILRPEYPLLSTSGWTQLLTESGFHSPLFVDPDSMAVDTNNDLASSPSKMIVSTPLAIVEKDPRRLLIVAERDANLAYELAARLQTHAASVHVIEAESDGNDAATLGRRVAEHCRSMQPTDLVVLSHAGGKSNASPVEELTHSSERLLAILKSIIAWQTNASSQTTSLRLRYVTCGGLAVTNEKPDLVGGSLWGLWRTFALEQPQITCSGIDLDAAAGLPQNADVLFDELSDQTPANEEIAFRDGLRFVHQWNQVPSDHDREQHGRVLCVSERGSLDGLKAGSRLRAVPKSGEVEIRIATAGLNFRDVLNVLGAYPGNPPLGAECAGEIVRVADDVEKFSVGDAVVAIAADCFGEYITIPATSVCHIPQDMTLSSAVTLPVAFLTADSAINHVAGLRAGESILIHSAAGGVGLAAVQIAKQIGATVYATASESKHEILRKLGIEHVFDSRKPGFARAILNATDGRGVDVILNSLGEEFIDENLSVIRTDGRYVDIALANSAVTSRIVATGSRVRYAALDLSQRLAEDSEAIGTRLEKMMQQVQMGEYQTLPLREFDFDDVTEAMQWLLSGTNIGKAVIRCCSDPTVLAADTDRNPSPALSAREHDREAFPPRSSTQIITGGLGGLGLLTAEYLLQQGASEVVLLTRRVASDTENALLAQWQQKYSASVTVEVVQLHDPASVIDVLKRVRRRCGEITGIYHLAGTLDDALLDQQTGETMQRVIAAKAAGAWNLHQATLTDPIRDFVLFSSFSAWLGSPGQANHATANAFLDSLASDRRSSGLPAVSIAWGPWARVGAAANRDRLGKGDLAGIGMLMPDEGVQLLDQVRHLSNAVTLSVGLGSSGSGQDVRLHSRPKLLTSSATEVIVPAMVAAVRLHLDRLPVHLQSHRLFAGLLNQSGHGADAQVTHANWLSELTNLTDPQRRERVVTHLRSAIATSLALPGGDSVPLDQPLFDLGMDSLTSLELVNSLQSTMGVRMSTIDLFNFPDVRSLATRLLELLSDTLPKNDSTEKGALEPPDIISELELSRSDAVLPVAEVTDLLREIGDLSEQFERWGAHQ
jgi:acyl transferase domain-containing protein/acyl-CoA synthetase (AMP-forming)/AMP-acid ligase II/NADPH:quinone reductase-like Zn-dependent oxidoreductase/acyl carrier protein/ubiquinone/menaquinone biosynthesis C-methylase UbiE